MRALLAVGVVLALCGCPSDGAGDAGEDAGSPCLTATDCPQAGPCESWTCSARACKHSFLASGTSAGGQTSGDCKRLVCDGSGGTKNITDDNDLPSDVSGDCQAEGCA